MFHVKQIMNPKHLPELKPSLLFHMKQFLGIRGYRQNSLPYSTWNKKHSKNFKKEYIPICSTWNKRYFRPGFSYANFFHVEQKSNGHFFKNNFCYPVFHVEHVFGWKTFFVVSAFVSRETLDQNRMYMRWNVPCGTI